MGLFSTSAHERAKRTWEASTLAKRSLEDATLHMRDIERTLQRITAELPSGANGSAIKPVQKKMEIIARHAQQTNAHFEHLKAQLRHLEEHIRAMRK